MRLERHATYWRADGEFELDGASCASAWEVLDVNVTLDAKPHAMLGNVVVFYDKTDREMARCRHLDVLSGNHLLFLGSRWWQIGNASIVQRNGRWCVKYHLCSNTSLARQANAGLDADRRAQLAASN